MINTWDFKLSTEYAPDEILNGIFLPGQVIYKIQVDKISLPQLADGILFIYLVSMS